MKNEVKFFGYWTGIRQRESFEALGQMIDTVDSMYAGNIQTASFMLLQGKNDFPDAEFSTDFTVFSSFFQVVSPVSTPKPNPITHETSCGSLDNSTIGKEAMLEGRPPKCFHVYNKTGIGTIGMNTMFYSFYSPTIN